MSRFEVTYRAATGRVPEMIEAISHAVDESTTPPTHRFETRGRVQTSSWIERVDVESVREVTPDPRPPFTRQVSNREYPSGKRPSPGAGDESSGRRTVVDDHDGEMTREDLVDEAKEKAEDLLEGVKGVARSVLKKASEEIAEHRGGDDPVGAPEQ